MEVGAIERVAARTSAYIRPAVFGPMRGHGGSPPPHGRRQCRFGSCSKPRTETVSREAGGNLCTSCCEFPHKDEATRFPRRDWSGSGSRARDFGPRKSEILQSGLFPPDQESPGSSSPFGNRVASS